jgi:hypothetical protein
MRWTASNFIQLKRRADGSAIPSSSLIFSFLNQEKEGFISTPIVQFLRARTFGNVVVVLLFLQA